MSVGSALSGMGSWGRILGIFLLLFVVILAASAFISSISPELSVLVIGIFSLKQVIGLLSFVAICVTLWSWVRNFTMTNIFVGSLTLGFMAASGAYLYHNFDQYSQTTSTLTMSIALASGLIFGLGVCVILFRSPVLGLVGGGSGGGGGAA